jgi:hypothetical protein
MKAASRVQIAAWMASPGERVNRSELGCSGDNPNLFRREGKNGGALKFLSLPQERRRVTRVVDGIGKMLRFQSKKPALSARVKLNAGFGGADFHDRPLRGSRTRAASTSDVSPPLMTSYGRRWAGV